MRYLHTMTIAALACLAACKDKPKAASQSFAEGMALLCGAGDQAEAKSAPPADRPRVISEWVDARVTNPEARNVFEAIGALSLPEVQRVLDEEARKAGLDGCALARTLDPLANVELPEVGDLPLAPLPEDAIVVIASGSAVVVEGTSIVSLRDHQLDPAELENGRIPKLRRFLEAMEADEVVLAVHPRAPYHVLYAIAGSVLPRAPAISLIARGGDGPGAIPLAIPAAPAAEDGEALGMVVSLTADEAIVFSLSGQEGTPVAPLLRMPAADAPAAIRAALADLAKRRWSGGADRPAQDRGIVVMAERDVPVGAVVAMLAAVRESFPEVQLGSGR